MKVAFIFKTSIDSTIWSVTLNLLQSQHDGSILVGSYSDSFTNQYKANGPIGGNAYFQDYWLLKLDLDGKLIWEKNYGGDRIDILYSIDKYDDGYLLSGVSRSNIFKDKTERSRGLYDIWLVKINESGSIIWDKTIGGDKDDYASTISINESGEIVISGESSSTQSGEKTENTKGVTSIWTIKLGEAC